MGLHRVACCRRVGQFRRRVAAEVQHRPRHQGAHGRQRPGGSGPSGGSRPQLVLVTVRPDVADGVLDEPPTRRRVRPRCAGTGREAAELHGELSPRGGVGRLDGAARDRRRVGATVVEPALLEQRGQPVAAVDDVLGAAAHHRRRVVVRGAPTHTGRVGPRHLHIRRQRILQRAVGVEDALGDLGPEDVAGSSEGIRIGVDGCHRQTTSAHIAQLASCAAV